MALFTTKGPDIPKGHVPLTRRMAVQFQMDLIETLAPVKNSCFIRYGPHISSFLGVATTTMISGFYRNSVDIGNINRVYTMIPFTIVPGLAHYFLHRRFVRNDIIIQKWACPYCYHMRSTFFQSFFGIALPIATSSVTAFAIARRLKKPGVPPLNHGREIFKFFLDKTRLFSRTLLILTVAQLIVGGGIAHAEAMENNYFNNNIELFIAEYEKKKKESSS